MPEKDEFSAQHLIPDKLRLLGARICLRRVVLGLSQRDLVNDTYYERLINDVESGLAAPSDDFVAYLAEALATTPQAFFEDGFGEAVGSTGLQDPRLAEQEHALMNAHLNIEMEKPEIALEFLAPYDRNPDELAPELKPVFFRLRGNAHLLMKRHSQAEADLLEALRLFEDQSPGNPFQTEVVRNLIGLNFYREGRTKEALKVHQECLEGVLKNNITNRRFRMILYTNMANEYYMLGNSDLAIKIFKNDAAPLAEQGEDDFQLGLVYWGLGLAYKSNHNLAYSVLSFDRSVKLFQKCQAPRMEVQVLDQLGLALIERKDYPLAEDTLLNALDKVAALGVPRIEAIINGNLAYLYQKKGAPEQALPFIEAAIKIEREINDSLMLGQSLVTLAEIKLAIGNVEAGFKDYEEAITWLDRKNQPVFFDNVMENYAEALKNQGQFEKALEIRFRMSHVA